MIKRFHLLMNLTAFMFFRCLSLVIISALPVFCVYEISQLLQTLFAHPIENYKYLLDNLPRCFILHCLNTSISNRRKGKKRAQFDLCFSHLLPSGRDSLVVGFEEGRKGLASL